MLHEQPLQRLERNAGSRPGSRVAGRDLAGIGEAGLQPGAVLAVDTPMTPLPRMSTFMDSPLAADRQNDLCSAAYVLAEVAPAQAGENFVADRAGLLRQGVHRVPLVDKINQAVRLQRICGQVGYIESDGVH